MAELLIELLSEEIPARMQARAADDLKRLITDGLKAAGLAWTRADAYATPRRLALVVDGLPAATPDRSEEIKGPRVGAPDQAVQGFLRKVGGGRTLADCEKRSDGKSESWVFVNRVAGEATTATVARALGETVKAFPWPKSMRWGALRQNWVRPLQGIVVLFDGVVVPQSIDLGGATKTFGNATVGHRFLAPASFAVKNFADYRDRLRAAFVILDPAERRAEIERQAKAAAATAGLALKDDPGLLDEVAGLVEWPVAHVGTIDAPFMELPGEVLSTSMRTHQRYFTLLKPDGTTAPRFVVVANMRTEAAGTANIVAGNERVLRARLSDAKFFWDQDRRARLDSRVPALKERTFYAKLGTMEDKVVRLQALAAALAPMIPGCEPAKAERAAFLAKADLSTGMVGEFPELQGIMGRYYAKADGEDAAVAEAIREHYQPLGPGDSCPSAPVSIAVSLADKLDTLVGFFAIGEKPTGSKDPFALRRAALGVIRLVVENRLRIGLEGVFASVHRLFANQLGSAVAGSAPTRDLVAFFADRLKVALREQGVRHDLIDAVFALGGEDDLVRLLARVDALKGFLGGDDGHNLLVAFRRASNIVAIEEKKDKTTHGGAVAPGDLVAPEEQALNAALDAAGPVVAAALAREDFAAAMTALAGLRGPVDAFFDKVTVNDSNPGLRANRLRLLSRIRATLGQVADFTRIEG
ncbi:MAG: glycine--tRNA ligase subunit beta [Phreatobacter sp.]|uniref:glycine--tRNA ligase subunit beta n=1 Tax=Phreatobacter sp. TaxID=1966341 RepID=UPI001A457DD9|nr:glycine--tRNA ligase subunit beta [Phreatobacter sp.]MBL8571885.1 glycine--tRNA ligase subunit beta [Phreatobacter sp.]